jgi:ATPases involved in chromosome partitioning
MRTKRITLFAGHYGSGKTNIAVNYALFLAKQGLRVSLGDLDIVNPYYRAKDSEKELSAAGVKVISSAYANSNVDVPAMPQEAYALTEDRTTHAVLDVGGDDRGALALGRYVPAIQEENEYEMLFVFNRSRPLTRDAQSALGILREIEEACRLPFTGIVHNTNLGRETRPETLLDALPALHELEKLSGLPVIFTAARSDIAALLPTEIGEVFPITLQKTIW